MKKEVCLVKLTNDKLCLIPIEKILEEDAKCHPQPCKIITQEIYGWWVHEKTIEGGAYDGIGSEIIVRDIAEQDIKSILDNKGKCFVETNSSGVLSTPRNIRNSKIVIHLEK
jgi:hypothetical protein